jgi:hypothetical protein
LRSPLGSSILAAVVVLSTLGFDRTDDLFVIVHADDPPLDQDWQRMVEFTCESLPHLRRGLVIAGNAKLDAAQRRSLAEALKGANVNVAVLVASPLARGAVTALGWLIGGYRAFDMHELDKAFSYLRISEAHQMRARRSIREIQDRLSAVHDGSAARSNR